MNSDIIRYTFRKNIYFSLKDISLGIMIASNKELLYGLLGRISFIELNLIFIHIKLGFIRSGHVKNNKKELETYKLTFVDKLYFFFNDDYYKRYGYLFPKVEKHQKQWFREKNISFPYDFYKYLKNYTENLIFEFSSNYE